MKQITTTLLVVWLAGSACGDGPPKPTPQPPVVNSINPASGSAGGGTNVTIGGSNFSSPTVTIGGVAATVTGGGTTSVSATTGAHGVGKVDVVVRNSDGQSGTLSNGYEYVPSVHANPGGPYSADANRTVTFSGLSSTSVPFPIARYDWTCGQPTGHRVACNQSGPTPTFNYGKSGRTTDPPIVYTVTLTVTDTQGNSDTATTTISVRQVY